MKYGFAYNLHDRWNENYYADDYSGGGNYYGWHGYGQSRGHGRIPSDLRGQGYGPEGPSYRREENPAGYLSRHGVSRHRAARLPKELTNLYGDDSCGLCGIEFTSTSMFQIHYMSRNHFKLQKKWLSQYTARSRRSNMKPFRPRRSYCELCDVELSSETTANSHYLGKQHRSIVLGRKQTKNPSLLREDMRDRLERLIRREKRSINFAEEVEEKPVQADLCCNICKTSVTCYEQLTIHLNGKRHLAKEKHHILTMMKAANTERNAQAPEISEEEVEREDEDSVSGRGDWDDDPQ